MSQVLNSRTRPAVSRRRSALKVPMDILRATAAGHGNPAEIVCRCNASWTVLLENLESLVASGFIRENFDGSRTVYEATDKGKAALSEYLHLAHTVVS